MVVVHRPGPVEQRVALVGEQEQFQLSSVTCSQGIMGRMRLLFSHGNYRILGVLNHYL